MSREEYQRAVADIIRSPALCRAAIHGQSDALDSYALTEVERVRLRSMARQGSMKIYCMLYRASRLVGITRRLPVTIALLGDALRPVFDAYLRACPDASPEFDREAIAFGGFVLGCLDRGEAPAGLPEDALAAAIRREMAELVP